MNWFAVLLVTVIVVGFVVALTKFDAMGLAFEAIGQVLGAIIELLFGIASN